MSEYQYYEFQAVDRPLTEDEIKKLRSCSSRATITATRFVNEYHYGDFKGDTSEWMEKYFDAYLYLSSWGTRELMLRLPRRVLDLKNAKLYCGRQVASVRAVGELVILELFSEQEGDDWEGDGGGWLSSLIPLRADIAAGDHRALYLAWLLCVQSGDVPDDATEPPVPPGLGDLTAPLVALADFLRIDDDLITVAATRSPEVEVPALEEVERWIAALPDDAKIQWLVRLAGGREPQLHAELLRSFRESLPSTPLQVAEPPRTAGELLDAAEAIADQRGRLDAERALAAAARKEREEAEARERYLTGLAQREAQAWQQVDSLIATKQPRNYDQAVQLLRDLQEVGVRDGRSAEVDAHLLRLFLGHAKKQNFIQRLKAAGLA